MIGLTIDGLDRFDGLAQRIRAALRQEASDLAEDLRARVQSGPLDGGVLHRRTGRLAGSVTATVDDEDGVLTLVLGADAPYARFQELGFRGTEAVRASLRTIREAFGRPIRSRSVSVRAHTRRINYRPHPFLEPVLDAARSEITDRLAAAVQRVAAS